jgi:UDP-N-acetylglucosamine transferase subunit ALG13
MPILAGSGSIFEGLSAERPMIVVPNARLMHNHQVELAEQLAAMQHLASHVMFHNVAA